MSIQPFKIEVPDAELDDLKARLGRIRWPGEIRDSGWSYGTNLDYLKQFCDYWRDRFDWRAQEAALNRYTSCTAGARVRTRCPSS